MKKYFSYVSITAVILMFSFGSCTNDVPDYDGDAEGKVSKVKTLTYKDEYWEETFEFNYLDNGRVSSIINSYENTSVDYIFDWSVPGKLTVNKAGEILVYEVNTDGYVTKDPEEWGYYNVYEYDENGFLIKVTEHWDGGSEVKFEVETRNNNVMKHKRVRSGKDYEKAFEFTTGTNLCDIQQTNPVDSYWKNQSGMYGKASNRLLRSQTYGYVGETMTSVKLGYTFDDNRRPASITRAGTDWSETVTYTYVD